LKPLIVTSRLSWLQRSCTSINTFFRWLT